MASFVRANAILLLSFTCVALQAQTPLPSGTSRPGSQSRSTAVLPSNANSLESLVASPGGWRDFDWSNPTALNESNWSKRESPDSADDGTAVTHERVVNYKGLKDAKLLRWRTNRDEADIKLSVSAGAVHPDTCAELASKAGIDLGAARYSDESSRLRFSDTIHMQFVNRIWQWMVGGTRISAACGGVLNVPRGDSKDEVWFSVSFEPASRRPEVRPPFLLRCSRAIRVNGTAIERSITDLVIWISQDQKLVRDTETVQIGTREMTTVDEFRINFTLQNSAKAKTKYQIDRVTGTLKGDYQEDGSSNFAVVSGSCTKVDSAAKF